MLGMRREHWARSAYSHHLLLPEGTASSWSCCHPRQHPVGQSKLKPWASLASLPSVLALVPVELLLTVRCSGRPHCTTWALVPSGSTKGRKERARWANPTPFLPSMDNTEVQFVLADLLKKVSHAERISAVGPAVSLDSS